MFYWLIVSLSVFFPMSLYAKNDLVSVLAPAMNWNTSERISALEKLCQIAGILEPDQALKALYPERESDDLVAQDLLEFITQVQRLFRVRGNSQENWDPSLAAWDNYSFSELEPQLQVLGLVESVYPKSKKVDAVCVIGDKISYMDLRVDFAQYLIQKDPSPYFLLLSGDRPLALIFDGSKNSLDALAKRQNLVSWKGMTEMEALRDLLEYSKKRFKVRPDIIEINTPSGDAAKPTMNDTMNELFKTLKDLPIHSITFVVNQPVVSYNRELLGAYMHQTELAYEIVGPAVPTPVLKDAIESLGHAIWAAGPRLLSLLHLSEKPSDDLLMLAQSAYQTTPILYTALPRGLQELEP